MKSRVGVIAVIFAVLLSPLTAYADVKEQGLFVEPSKWSLEAEAGKVTDASFTVANYTKDPLTINLSVKQFAATSYDYDYKFSDPKDDWIRFEKPRIALEPGEKVRARFVLDVPAIARPGGYYFALHASAELEGESFRKTVNVISTLYVTVGGELVRSGVVDNGRVPFFVLDGDIVYKFDARNTGNVHYSAQLFGQLEGLFVDSTMQGTRHLLMPEAVRTIGGALPAPKLPGVYKLTYGYKTDGNKVAASKTAYVVVMPPWFILVLLGALYAGMKLWRRKRRKA